MKDSYGNNLVDVVPGKEKYAQASGAFGGLAHAYPGYRSAQKISARIRNHITGHTQYGLSVGQAGAGSGLFGGPLLSPGYRTGMSGTFENLIRTGAGFNPNYSTAQGKDAMDAAASYGYDVGGDRGNYFIDAIGTLQRAGFSGEQAASLLDPSMRYGLANVKDLSSSIADMGRAAGEAGVNMQQATLQAQQYGDQIAQQLGTYAPQERTLQLQGLSTVLGSPQVSGQLGTDQTLQNIIIAQKGGFYQAATSKTPNKDLLTAEQTFMRPLMGGSFSQLRSVLNRKGKDPQKMAALNNIYALARMGQLPGGMSAQQFLTQVQNGSIMHGAHAEDLIAQGRLEGNHLSNGQMRTLEKLTFGKQWQDWASEHKDLQGKDRINAIGKVLADHAGKANTKAGTRVRITLDPTAAKYIRASVEGQENKSAHSNSNPVVRAAGWAMDTAGGLLNGIADATDGH